ncbi:hypothetical protein DCC85_12465 [Paenibacillus sp. CAA11]|uniref:hypothetical protein n=1 Tax=Paenibacillus sp. CAA11 TaxID=1532905 RepID=UPI000D34959D|nr:hypothetical protein [Paenibacillus sp. CAA11]AWB44950.1 hypothetical protein DCC85_12465 [Paenibacillus sp. CAA11]
MKHEDPSFLKLIIVHDLFSLIKKLPSYRNCCKGRKLIFRGTTFIDDAKHHPTLGLVTAGAVRQEAGRSGVG